MSRTIVRRALLVGVNKYRDSGNDLKGCVNDALMMAKLLTQHYQFSAEDIRLLTDERATTAGIRTRLEWLTSDVAAGSVLVFHFSGHGSQVRDRDGDELDDDLDEILCPHDFDWDDPFTDDEIARVVRAVPDGVNFTVILDCCHSGTGTREFFKEPSAGRAPNPRYLVPPPDIAFRAAQRIEFDTATPERTVNMAGLRQRSPRRFGTAVIDQNVVLVAGCRSDQTSADAWIENDNRGALSYSLGWAAARGQWGISNLELVRGAGAWLETNGYSQEPQLEAPEAMQEWAFLSTNPPRKRVSVAGALAPVTDRLAPVPPDVHVVCVHGIGDHRPGWSSEWRRVFNPQFGLPLENWIEVEWDSVFDAPRAGDKGFRLPVAELSQTEKEHAKTIGVAIKELLVARQTLLTKSTSDGLPSREFGSRIVDRTVDRGFFHWLTNFDEYIGDFVKYLVSETVREQVDQRLLAKLRASFDTGHRVVLLTHSWGTVVGYNALRRIAASKREVALHVTFGSPLWMAPVRLPLGFDGERDSARHWINLDAEGDIIGGELAGLYQVEHDYVVPVPSTNGGPHSSFFSEGNGEVQVAIVPPAVISALA